MRGVVFDGGSRDGQVLERLHMPPSIALACEVDGEEWIEVYELTGELRDGLPVARCTDRRRDLDG